MSHHMTRLAIVGSRCLKDSREAQAAVLKTILYWQRATPNGRLEIVSGGAEGPDSMTEAIAENLGLPMHIFRPDAEALRRIFDQSTNLTQTARRQQAWAVYKARNVALVEHCTHLLCVRCPTSETRGAFWTEAFAKRGRRVIVLRTVEIACGTHPMGAA